MTNVRDESITAVLRQEILSGVFPQGERLLEVSLAERYECGRAAVRSALVELGSEGLVEKEVNRGARVRRISIEEAIQITEARAVLESLIARRAAANATKEQRVALGRIVDDMRAAVSTDATREYSALNAVLHRNLRECSGHEVASHLVDNLRNRAAHHQYRLAVMPGRAAESLEQHAAIVEAVVAGDESGAAAAMRLHLESVVDALRLWGDAPSST